ncbi:hypothetical protein LCGC14_1386810 [marine sediment metagenome]|uniref:Endonuclease VII n=1 Tax=marine sediment metagenome TaxID=412755 RepID=A0A0F9K182_9ZZZZ
MAKKVCTRCKIAYPATVENFPKCGRKKDGLDSWCKLCKREYNVKYQLKHKKKLNERSRSHYASNKGHYAKKHKKWREANPKYARDYQYKLKYGISLVTYDYIWDRQGGVCKICKLPNKNGKRLAVDHNHETGKVRGLLCANCNVMLGFIERSPEIFESAADYLFGRT